MQAQLLARQKWLSCPDLTFGAGPNLPLPGVVTHTHTHNLFRPAGLTRKGNYHTSTSTFPKMDPGLLKPIRPHSVPHVLNLLPRSLRVLVG
jgi:hypothetical protein